jgi:beta-lactamase regulating signal transducer with metallopeptidase domain
MPVIDTVATALLTYAAHSFAACSIALLAARLVRRPQDRDIIWKAALIAPIVTATIAITLSANGARSPFVDLGDLARRASPARLPERRVLIRVIRDGDARRTERWFADPVTSALSTAALALVLLVAGVASGRLIVRRRRLARAVSNRRDIGELALANGETARVSSSSALQTPVAFNRVEICMPDDVVREFSERHQRALIAHEIAHLERRDPAWFVATEIIAALSAFQPLTTVVVRAFRRDVELICDETAVHRTNDHHSLISALALLASPFDPRSPLHGAATAYDGSPLVGRAERIAMLKPNVASSRVTRPILIAMSAALAILCAVPVVSAAPRLTDFPLEPTLDGSNLHVKRKLDVEDRSASHEIRRIVTVLR